MKRIILLLITAIISTTMMAEGITAEQAAEIARQFVDRQAATGSGQAAQGRQMRMAAKRQMPMSMATETNSNAFYVFNIGSNDGYVMVSGSDLTPQVLGYTSEGSFSEDDMPANMKAWLDGYAEQIAYIERTQGSNQAPVMRIAREAIDPLLTTTWDQNEPFNGMCPTYDGSSTLTGCTATALAQVINYHKYPSQTIAPIPAYTTKTHGTNMPEMPVTDIDWANMIDDYSGNATAEQRNAVATLMRLCAQALMTDLCTSDEGGSAAFLTDCITGLRQYFGYDETMRYVYRNTFSTSEWEELIYNELDNDRPVPYGGQSVQGGHSFVVDGYNGDGLFHINWGWGGVYDGYFLLSVVNPYNNETLGTSSSNDGFSFEQAAVVGIQHGTGEVIGDRLVVFNMRNEGETTYTRASATEDFSGMEFSTRVYNMTGYTQSFMGRMALVDDSGNYAGWFSEDMSYDEVRYCKGYMSTVGDISFGTNLADGDYYIITECHTVGTEDWGPCWGSSVYRIKATISGNMLTLTEPQADLSGSFAPIDSTEVFSTVNLKAQITNNGTDFIDYVYLDVDNIPVGGRILEVKAGETTTFEMDFVPTTSGTHALSLYFIKNARFSSREVIFITTDSITVTGEVGEPHVTGSITLTNANSQGNVEETTAKIAAEFINDGTGSFVNGYVLVDLFKYSPETNNYIYLDSKYKLTTIATGSSTTFTTAFTGLEDGGKYVMQLRYTLDYGRSFTTLEESITFFEVKIPAGIETPTVSDLPFDVYTTTGVKVKSQATSLKGLPEGVYIVKGKTLYIKHT